MELKYKSTDVDKMINVFSTISKNENNTEVIFTEMEKLVEYPANIIQEFLKCMTVLSNKDNNYIKENYIGIIGYITLRLNFCKNISI